MSTTTDALAFALLNASALTDEALSEYITDAERKTLDPSNPDADTWWRIRNLYVNERNRRAEDRAWLAARKGTIR